MNVNQFSEEMKRKMDTALSYWHAMAGQEAQRYFRGRFTEKEFDGTPWKPVSPGYHPKRGSLMVRTGELMKSVRYVPRLSTKDKAVIVAGNYKVGYAKAHNEGFIGNVVVPTHERTSRKGKKYTVKEHTRKMNLPRRTFMASSRALEKKLAAETEKMIQYALKQ